MKTKLRFSPASLPGFRAGWTLLLVLLLSLTACTTPVGTNRVSERQAYRELDRSALNSNHPSSASHRVLHRFNLDREFARHPASALDQLLARAQTDGRRDILFALAELSCLHADHLRQSVKPGAGRRAPDYYLLSVIASFAYLFGPGTDPLPSPYERQFRNACDLYARSLALAFSDPTSSSGAIRLAPGRRHLPGGDLQVTFSTAAFPYSLDGFAEFIPASSLAIRGISVRDTDSGLGAPLVGVFRERPASSFRVTVPATLLGRFDGDLNSLRTGHAAFALELYSPYHTNTVQIAGRQVPLEADLTAAIAYALNDARIWSLDLDQFLYPIERVRTGIYPFQPGRPGRIPVVFVHGTLSSPIWWVEMMNTLYADRTLRERFQFWFFIYNSGNPIGYSAAKLRQALQEQVRQLDPDGQDPALRQMVIIGHSQGGLLTKLTATDTGDALWRQVCPRDFDSVPLPPDQKEAIRQSYFFTPLPCVKRVVFLCTPHRGSHLASTLVRNLVRRFIRLPEQVVHASEALFHAGSAEQLAGKLERKIPTALDDMSPRNRWLAALAQQPVSTNVIAHSIIAIKGRQIPPAGSDGVVRYASAHVAYSQSELVVRSGHTCQNQPAAIEEIRRILLEHAQTCAPQSPAQANIPGAPVAAQPSPAKTTPRHQP